ncbi:unnamed protein product [Moneuplotes crassus]|uniref:Uncharacterized protein n=1 Tax=Euplotes crassus TaxID=5936 RepID=A0AAD1X4L3_EUPCR|nr:unnamed protein product [Moneuplotes crassus]
MNQKPFNQRLFDIIATKEYMTIMYVMMFVILKNFIYQGMASGGTGANWCYFLIHFYMSVTNLLFFLMAASEVRITILIKRNSIAHNGNPNWAANGHPNGYPNAVPNGHPNPAVNGPPPVVDNGPHNRMAVVPINNPANGEARVPGANPSSEAGPTWLLILSIFIGFFWYALFCFLQNTKSETRKPDNATLKKNLLITCAGSSLQWLLYILLPVFIDGRSGPDFWIPFLIMLYYQMFCYSIYFQTRAYLFEVEWLPYFSPITWLFLIGAYISMICGTNSNQPNGNAQGPRINQNPAGMDHERGLINPPADFQMVQNGNPPTHPQDNPLENPNRSHHGNDYNQIPDDPEKNPRKSPKTNNFIDDNNPDRDPEGTPIDTNSNVFHPKDEEE